MQRVASDLEAQILFGKQERQVAYTFVHPDLESFAKEQGVIGLNIGQTKTGAKGRSKNIATLSVG
jgi:hypothetical protein